MCYILITFIGKFDAEERWWHFGWRY